MALYPAIAATGLAIQNLLTNASTGTEFDGATFPLFQGSDFVRGIADGVGVSIYLYRVAPNATRRNEPPRLGPDGLRYRPALTLDMFYMLTVWGADADKQQRLLAWTMRVLEDSPVLTANLLNERPPEPEVFRPDETIELVQDPLSVQDMNVLWDLFKLNQQRAQQLSVTYAARMVALESSVPLEEAGLVQTREFDYTKVYSP